MLREDHTLFDEFQLKGYWWRSDAPDKRVPGVVTYGEKGITLDLFGDLSNLTTEERGIVQERGPIPLIHGVLDNGKRCTLDKVWETSSKWLLGMEHVASATYAARILFIGKHFTSPGDFKFSSFGVNYTNLEEWLADRPFKSQPIEEGDKSTGIDSEYRTPETFHVELPTDDATLSSNYRFMTSGNWFRSHTVEHVAFIQITPKVQRAFDWYWEKFTIWQNLMTILINEPVYAKRIIGYGDTEEIVEGTVVTEEILVYPHFPNERTWEDKLPIEMLAPFPHIRHMWKEVVAAWYEKAEKLQTVFALFFGTVYNASAYQVPQFLNLMHALESYSRTTMVGTHTTPDKYATIEQAIVAAIPTDTPSSLKSALKEKLKYGNEISLRRRVGEILKTLEKETVALIIPNADSFKNKVANTRNYYTHYTDELKKEALSGPALWRANQRLRLLLTILLMKEIGVNEPSIRNVIATNPKLMQTIHLHLRRDD